MKQELAPQKQDVLEDVFGKFLPDIRFVTVINVTDEELTRFEIEDIDDCEHK